MKKTNKTTDISVVSKDIITDNEIQNITPEYPNACMRPDIFIHNSRCCSNPIDGQCHRFNICGCIELKKQKAK